jgi:hypothetical protein
MKSEKNVVTDRHILRRLPRHTSGTIDMREMSARLHVLQQIFVTLIGAIDKKVRGYKVGLVFDGGRQAGKFKWT